MADEEEAQRQQQPTPPVLSVATSWPRTVESAFEWQAGTAAGAQAGLVNAIARSAEPVGNAVGRLAARVRRVSGAGSPGAADDDEARAAGFGSGIEEEGDEEEDYEDEDEDEEDASDGVFFPAEGMGDGGSSRRAARRRSSGGGSRLRPPPAAAGSDRASLTQPLLLDDDPDAPNGGSSSHRRRSFLLEHGHPILPPAPPQPPAGRLASLALSPAAAAAVANAAAAAHAAAHAADANNDTLATREASVPALPGRVPVRLVLEEADRSGSSSTLAAALNAVNVLCGVGLLAMPFATVQAGWVSFFLLAAVAAVALFSGALLEACMSMADGPPPHEGEGALCAGGGPRRSRPGQQQQQQQQQQQRPALLRSFPDLGGAAFGRSGRVLVALLLYLELLSCTIDFLVLEGDSLAALIPPGGWILPSPSSVALFGGAVALTRQQAFALLAAAGVLPTVLLRDLSALSYLSAGGILGSLAIVGCLFGSMGGGGGGGGGGAGVAAAAMAAGSNSGVGLALAASHHPPSLLPNLPFVRAAGLPVALGLYSFSFSGAACFPSIYVSMRERRRFPALLAGAFGAVAALYAIAAVAGLAAFGEGVADQVTLSMRAERPGALATRLATWLVVLSPLTKIALTLAPVAMAVEEVLLVPPAVVRVAAAGAESANRTPTLRLRRRHQRGRKTRNALVSAALRTALLAGCAVAAVSVPFFALLSQVIGAFMCLNISVVLPCLFFLRLRWRWAPTAALVAAGLVAAAAELGSVLATWHALAALAAKYGGGGGGGGGVLSGGGHGGGG